MTDFFDWLTASDSGIGADRLADAFKLSHQELRKTTTALAPAFALALQRAMIVPGAWGEISRLYKPFIGDGSSDLAQGATTSPAAKDLATALFGSADLVSSVARQVSVASGVAPDTVEIMIRNISVMTIGTMLRMMMANLTRNQPRELAEGNYPGAMAEMLRRSANAVEAMGRPSNEPQRRPQPQMPGSDYLNKLFSDALTGTIPWLPPETAKPADSARPADPTGAGAFFGLYPALMEQFARNFQIDMPGAGETTSAKTAHPTPDAAPAGAAAAGTASAAKSSEGAAKAATSKGASDDLAEAALAFQKDYARRMMEIFTPGPAGKVADKDG